MSDGSIVVEARRLTKSYGRSRGIRDLDLDVRRGEVLGLVGANGAGKTTFMRILLDLVRPTSGSVRVFGMSAAVESVALRRRCAYLPGEFVLPAGLTGHQAVRRFTLSRGDVSDSTVMKLAERLDVDLGRKVGDLSKGNKQKVGLILAFAPAAELLVLDEPTSGLDPILQRVFAELVREVTAAGRTVLLSSHVMSEVEQVADRVALMQDGSIVVVDQMQALLARSRRRAKARPRDPADAERLAEALGRVAAVSDIRVLEGSVGFACQGGVDDIVKVFGDFHLESLDLAHADLEDAFFAELDQVAGLGDMP